MKKVLFIILLACIQMGAQAAKSEALIIKFKDNTTVQFILNESPKIKFVSDSIAITSTTLTGKYAYDGIRNLHFEEVNITGIKDNKVENNTIRVILTSRNEYTIDGLDAKTSVRIYSVAGKLMATLKPQDGCAKVSLQDFTDGTYIINVAGKHSLKVLKK